MLPIRKNLVVSSSFERISMILVENFYTCIFFETYHVYDDNGEITSKSLNKEYLILFELQML